MNHNQHTPDTLKLTPAERQELCRRAGVCINTSPVGRRGRVVHGAPITGGRCQRCLDVRKRSS